MAGDKVIFVGGSTSGAPLMAVDIFDSATGAWTTAALAEGRIDPAVTLLDHTVLFAGGRDVTGSLSRVVDVYDSVSNAWSSSTLAQPWTGKAAFTAGSRAMFPTRSVVDIYESETHTWSTHLLSVPRGDPSVAVVGGSLVIAGGLSDGRPSAAVDIYDASTGEWSSASLSEPRSRAAVAVVAGQAVFAGGDAGGRPSTAVDIYDSANRAWTSTTLVDPGSARLSTAAVGAKLLFAGEGGARPGGATVNIYDATSGEWSTASRSHSSPVTPVVVANKVLFMAWYEAPIDIYDHSSGQWSTATPERIPRRSFDGAGATIITVGSRVLLAGGMVQARVGTAPTDLVEVFDADQGTWSSARLSEPSPSPQARVIGSTVIFAGSKAADIYDVATDEWTVRPLSEARVSDFRGIADVALGVAGSHALIAGGPVDDPGGPGVTPAVDLFDATTGIWSTARLARARREMAVATVDRKVLFAGGADHRRGAGSHVADIYDTASGRWSAVALPEPVLERESARGYFGASLGSKALFYYLSNGVTRRVHVYDSATDAWNTFPLSMPRSNLTLGVVGSVALLAGGWTRPATHLADDVATDVVDIYDGSKGEMSSARLSEPRRSLAVATVGSKVLFAGGERRGQLSGVVDIFDSSTATWTTAELSQPRFGRSVTLGSSVAVAVVGSRAIFAGGNIGTTALDAVDIYDDATGEWSTASLSQPRQDIDVAVVGSSAVFAGGRTLGPGNRPRPSNALDVYDAVTGDWSSGTRPAARWQSKVLVVGEKAMFTGGITQEIAQENMWEIYDAVSGEWSTATPPVDRREGALTAIGGRVILGGGVSSARSETETGQRGPHSDVVIYDAPTGQWGKASLIVPRSDLAVANIGAKVVFAGGRVDLGYTSAAVDIYEYPLAAPPRNRRPDQ